MEVLPFGDRKQPDDAPALYETTFPIAVENGKFVQSLVSQSLKRIPYLFDRALELEFGPLPQFLNESENTLYDDLNLAAFFIDFAP